MIDLKKELVKDGQFAEVMAIYRKHDEAYKPIKRIIEETLKAAGADLYYDHGCYDQPRDEKGKPTSEIPSVISINANYMIEGNPRSRTTAELVLETKRVAALLNESDIVATASLTEYQEPCVRIDFEQPNFIEKLTAFQEAFKEVVMQPYRQGLTERDRPIALGSMVPYIPRKPDGSPLDPQYAADVVTLETESLQAHAKSLGALAEQAVRNTVSPRGRERVAKGDGSGSSGSTA